MAKVNSHANSMSIGNTHTKPYRLFDGIVGRTDVAEYRESSYAELVEAGAKGIKEIHFGVETARKGWLQTVAVCVVLMDRQFEAAIRTALIEPQSDQCKNSLKKKADRPLDPAHITIALNAVLKKGSSQEITGSAKTRLNKAVEYIQKLGCTLDERLARLDEFQSFNELQKAIKGDVAGAVNVSQEVINFVDARAKFKARARRYFAETDCVYATFEIDPVSRPPSQGGFYVMLCREKGDTIEVVGLNCQPEIISTVIDDTGSRSSLFRNQMDAEAAEMATKEEIV